VLFWGSLVKPKNWPERSDKKLMMLSLKLRGSYNKLKEIEKEKKKTCFVAIAKVVVFYRAAFGKRQGVREIIRKVPLVVGNCLPLPLNLYSSKKTAPKAMGPAWGI
jgi:hypothetical protein